MNLKKNELTPNSFLVGYDEDTSEAIRLNKESVFYNMPPDVIASTQLHDNAVNEAKIQTNAVTSSKIKDLAVTEDKLRQSSVTTFKIAKLLPPLRNKAATNKLNDLSVSFPR